MDLNSMTREELAEYGKTELGLTSLNMRMSADAMRNRIEAESAVSKGSEKASRKTTRIIIAKQAGTGGDAPVALAHNAVHTIMVRGEPIDCPDHLLKVLDDAVMQVEEQDDKGVFTVRNVQRYPYQRV